MGVRRSESGYYSIELIAESSEEGIDRTSSELYIENVIYSNKLKMHNDPKNEVIVGIVNPG